MYIVFYLNRILTHNENGVPTLSPSYQNYYIWLLQSSHSWSNAFRNCISPTCSQQDQRHIWTIQLGRSKQRNDFRQKVYRFPVLGVTFLGFLIPTKSMRGIEEFTKTLSYFHNCFKKPGRTGVFLIAMWAKCFCARKRCERVKLHSLHHFFQP